MIEKNIFQTTIINKTIRLNSSCFFLIKCGIIIMKDSKGSNRMAVSSKNSKKKKKKKKNSKKNEQNILKLIKKHSKIIIISTSIVIFIGISIYLIIPKIKIKGNTYETISYKDTYKESGYKATMLFKNIDNLVQVDNKVTNNKVGSYDVTYTLNYKFITINKKRTVIIIDDDKPEITTEVEEIKACPQEEKPEVSYTAYDEYDGDLTDKVYPEYFYDKLLLNVSDSSNNLGTKEIKVNRVDDEKPTITLKDGTTVYVRYGTTYTEPGYTATDNCDGDITDNVEVSGTVGANVGTYKLTYTVTDSAENTTEIVRNVIVKKNYLYNNGTIKNGSIYLTFDDGPSYGTTNVILDILKDEGVKATFFVTCGGPDELIKRIYNEGHTIALHTCSHDYSAVYKSVNAYFDDLNRVSDRVKRLTGYESKIIRFPGGSSNTVSRFNPGIMTTLTGEVLERGYRYYDWNVSSGDAGGAQNRYDVYNNVVNSLSHGRANMVLMHDIKAMTRDALRDIIQFGKNSGFTFEKIEMDTYMIRHGVNN